MEKVLKRENGITLVALVVTIIILLILAGVAIRSVTGENGLFQKAKIARVEADISEVIDNAKMDIMTKQIEKVDGSITEGELKTILEKYGDLSEEGETSILDKKLTTDKGGHEIEVRRIYDGPFGGDEEEMFMCKMVTIFRDSEEVYSVNFNNGIKWNYDIYDYPTNEDLNELCGDVLGIGTFTYRPEYSPGSEIIASATSDYIPYYLWAFDYEGKALGIVHWDDELIHNATYKWVRGE